MNKYRCSLIFKIQFFSKKPMKNMHKHVQLNTTVNIKKKYLNTFIENLLLKYLLKICTKVYVNP